METHKAEDDRGADPSFVRTLEMWLLHPEHKKPQYSKEVESPRNDREEIDQSYMSVGTTRTNMRLTPETSSEDDEESCHGRL